MAELDCIVVGLGGAGSSSVYHLARDHVSVLGLERYGPMHAHGSSHGRTRVYRSAYFEGPEYVPMLRRAQELWAQLQRESGERILQPTGGLVIGRPQSPLVLGSQRTAEVCGLPHEILDSDAVGQRFPQFALRPDEGAVFDPNAGALFPEACVAAHATGAADAGAELHYGEAVLGWTASAASVEVRTTRGSHRARHLVLTAGPWTSQLTPELALPLEIERQFMLWFSPEAPGLVDAVRMPVFVWDGGDAFRTYGLPDFGDGVKVGSWFGKPAASPESADRVFHEEDGRPVRDFARERLRGVRVPERDRVSCLYTNAPDTRFLIGRHPRHPNVFVISACSGHGFKFTSVIGDVVSRLVRGEPTGFDLRPFDPARFAEAAAPARS